LKDHECTLDAHQKKKKEKKEPMKIVVENLKVLYKGVGEPNDKFNNPIQLSTQSKFRDSININELL